MMIMIFSFLLQFIVLLYDDYDDFETFHIYRISIYIEIETDRLETTSLISMTPKKGILNEWN